MKLSILAAAVVLAGCATQRTVPLAPESAPDGFQTVSGGKVCFEDTHVRSRIPRVRCVEPGPQPGLSTSSMRCTGARDVCAAVGDRQVVKGG